MLKWRFSNEEYFVNSNSKVASMSDDFRTLITQQSPGFLRITWGLLGSVK